MCSGRVVRRWVGSAGIVFFSIGSLVGALVCVCCWYWRKRYWRGGAGDCSRMMSDRVGGVVLEHLFEVMKFTI